MTTIFLDVDGVLNAVRTGTPSQEATGWGDWQLTTVMGYPIWYSEDMVRALNELADRDDVDFVWLTTWQENAPAELAPAIGLKGTEWPVLYRDPEQVNPGWWKEHSLFTYLASHPNTKYVWIDDDMGYYHTGASFGNLSVTPDTMTGLTRYEYDTIVQYLNSSVVS